MKRPKLRIVLLVMALAAAMILSGCGSTNENTDSQSSDTEASDYGLDYLVLVNFENPMPEGWLDKVQLTPSINSVDDDVYTEVNAYKAYLKLKEDVEKELADQNVTLQLDSAYKSPADQRKIVEDFTEKYGEEYVKNYVAVPGYSEHHTGLALDLYFIVGDKTVYENEDLIQYPEIWAVIHEKLPKYGFILRYPEGKEKITGASHEQWHLRYVGSPEIAQEITDKGLTLEEYLAEKGE